MSRSNGVPSAFIFLLVFTSVFSPKLLAFGSPDEGQKFDRPDPLNHFKPYKGGYDVRDKHYWTSAAFTGVHGYAVAGAWMFGGLAFGIFTAVKKLRGGSFPIKDHLQRQCFLIFLLLLLFTLLVVVATCCVMATNQSSFQRTKKLKGTIVKAGDDTRSTIHKVIDAMTKIQYLLVTYDQKTTQQLNVTTHRLRKESRIINRFVQKYGHSIDLAIQTSYISHLVVVSVNLVLLAAALVLLLLHWHPGFVVIIFLWWILTTLCWLLTGFDFFLHIFADDTCSSLEDFVQNPQNNSLSVLLPCMDSLYSDKILIGIGSTVHNVISELNSKITELYQILGLKDQNDDSVGAGVICDPFSGAPNYTFIPGRCPKDAIPIGDLPNVLSRFTCYKEESPGTCRNNGKFISQASYNKAWAYSHSVQDMLNIFPDLQGLTECTIVKRTFSDILLHQCRSFRVSMRLLWASMLALSISTVLLLLTCLTKAYLERGRCFCSSSTRSAISGPN